MWRWVAVGLLLVGPTLSLLAPALPIAPAAAAPVDEVVMPLERYSTPKARALATTYRPQLVKFYQNIYHCIPWVDLQKNGIGFRTPRWATADDRYLSVWIWIDQNEDAKFSAFAPAERASAMFSRYGVELLRRMTALAGVASDSDVDGFSVILSWLKPGTRKAGVQPVNETLVLFIDRASGLDFLAKNLAAGDFLDRAKFSVFDGQQEMGRLPLVIWDDPFLQTFKLKNYEPPPDQHC